MGSFSSSFHAYETTDSLKANYEASLGDEALKSNRLETATIHYKNALEIYLKYNEYKEIASIYQAIACCCCRYNSEEAIYNYQKSNEYCRKVGARFDELDNLKELRTIYYNIGNMEEYAVVSAEIDEKIYQLPTAEMYIFLAKEKAAEDDYTGALDYYKLGFDLMTKDGEPEDVKFYRDICEDMINTLYSVGMYEETIQMIDYLEALERDKDMKTTNHRIRFLGTMRVNSLSMLGRKQEALEAADVVSEQLKDDSSAIMKSTGSFLKTMVYNSHNDFNNVLVYANEMDSILAIEFPADNEMRIISLDYKISANYNLDNYEEALRLADISKELKQNEYALDIRSYITDVFRRVNIEAYSGVSGNADHLQASKEHLAEYCRLQSDYIKHQAQWLTSDQRMSLWRKIQRYMAQVPSIATGLHVSNEQAIVDVYNAHVLTSGLLLKSEKSVADAVNRYGSDSDKTLYNEMCNLRDIRAVATRNKDIKTKAECDLKLQADENRLLGSIVKMPTFRSLLDADYVDIQRVMKPGEVLIDFAWSQGRINAFIIRKNWQYPQLKRICKEDEIYAISQSMDAALYTKELGSKMRALLLDSIQKYIEPGDRIYYVPDGPLHGIAFENLILEDGRPISDLYDLHRLSSASQLMYIDDVLQLTSAQLYGGLEYGDYVLQNMDATEEMTAPDGGKRGIGDAFKKLVYGDIEIKNINRTLKKKHINTVCLEKTEGTEESFIALDGKSPDIIHLSTHGYYLSPERARRVTGLAGYTDAMRLSGLVMSGGNAGWLGVPTRNGELDGLLTADDISKLDLSNTKLVVLSACKTASGEISPEGIFELQRAFKKAGAGSLVMTLWEVNDKATAQFMSYFYEELAKNGWNRHKAFANARESLKKLYPDDPYFWAGFVLVD